MKKINLLAAVFFAFLMTISLGPGISQAMVVTFDHTMEFVDFDSGDDGVNYTYSWTHVLEEDDFIPNLNGEVVLTDDPSLDLSTAFLTLDLNMSSGVDGDAFFRVRGDNYFIGRIEEDPEATEQIFVLDLKDDGDGGTRYWLLRNLFEDLTFDIVINTPMDLGGEILGVNSSTLEGSAIATPIPSAALLLATGLIGLIGFRRKMVG